MKNTLKIILKLSNPIIYETYIADIVNFTQQWNVTFIPTILSVRSVTSCLSVVMVMKFSNSMMLVI